MFAQLGRIERTADVCHLDLRSEVPTSAHLKFFLDTIHHNDASGQAAHSAWISSLPSTAPKRGAVDPSYVPTRPTLVVLHNPSEYIAEADALTAGVEAYASILAFFVATFSRGSTSTGPLLIVHDRPAADMSVPLLAPEHRPPKRPRLVDPPQDARKEDEDNVPLVQVLRTFFDRVGVADRVVPDPTEQRPRGEKRFRLVLDAVGDRIGETAIEWIVAPVADQEQVEGQAPMTAVQLVS